ncbi:MAG TPA: hypothetical protein VHT21_17215 [Stellaceae bacterium]|jgi:uncharacterized protein YegL|nr:hypothetical protein [Stellaceae bacterium]
MFLQLVTPSPPLTNLSAAAQRNVDSLWLYHPLQISALVETVWRDRYNAVSASNAPSSPFVAWPVSFTDAILGDPTFLVGYNFSTSPPSPLPEGTPFMPAGELPFTAPKDQPGIAVPPGGSVPSTNWDHLIYAYLVENTRIFDIFSKVLETYMFTERLETPSFATQQFLRNSEYLISDGLPTMVWTSASRLRRDEMANRMTAYYGMFGVDLAHAQQISAQHPYEKPAAANRDFIPTFEAFASEVWQGIQNAKNTSGVNSTDDEAISTAARRMFDMMATRRLNGNLSREEFRAVAIMSWLHLAIMYDSPVVQDLKASASSPELRLQKIAERVGMSAHLKTKPLLDLSQAFSFLLQSIETGVYNTPATTKVLYDPLGSVVETNAEIVIDQYSLATGRNLKASHVSVTERRTAPRLPPAAPARPNGRADRAAAA